MKTVERLLVAIATHFGVSVDDIKGDKKHRVIVDARRAFVNIVLSRSKQPYTYVSVGAMINKDHASVTHMVKKHKDLMETDVKYRKRYDSLAVPSEITAWSEESIMDQINWHLDKIRELRGQMRNL